MAWQKINRAIGGITPLGKFTITAGTPQNILVNTTLTNTRYALQARQIIVSVSSTVAGEVYLNYGPTAGFGNQTVLVIASGTEQAIPSGCLTRDGMIDSTQYYLDGSASCVCTVSLADATD